MDENFEIKSIKFNREDAKLEFQTGNYDKAKCILEDLWSNSNHSDVYLLYDYGRVLRKIGDSVIFVNACRDINNKKILKNKWISDMLCWCLYDCYIKDYSTLDVENYNDFIKRAEYIKNNCEQLNPEEYFKNPYVLTIKKVVKVLKEKPSKNYKKILLWLSYLNPDLLSEKVFNFKDGSGKDRELASLKEFYYQNMAKALEKTENYEACISICEEALKKINHFHYKNDVWINARMYYCKCMIEDELGNAIKEYISLAISGNSWFMFHKISLIFFRHNRIDEALLYASKAFECKFEYEKMVNILLDTAFLWQAKGNDTNLKLFFHASAYYRNLYGWYIPEELKYAIKIYEMDLSVKPNIEELKIISKNYILSVEGTVARLKGKVVNVLHHGNSGFIKPYEDKGENIYFKMSDVNSNKVIVKGDNVEYELYKYDGNKVKAIKITLRR